MTFNPADHPHRRYNPLLGEYVLVSPHRMKRPWQGKVETPPPDNRPEYDATCYLCPGNVRANGEQNPHYEQTFVFINDFAALLPDTPMKPADAATNLFSADPVRGTSRVICFSPKHNHTLPQMTLVELRGVADMWAEQVAELGAQYQWVQVFETKGDIMGTSNMHPHGQIWASDFLPNEAYAEDRHQKAYYEQHGSALLLDYLHQELERDERIIVKNEHWVALVPYWAYWPFETMIVPRRAVQHLHQLTSDERDGLGDVIKRMLTRYDNLFKTSFPYGSGWHGMPFNGQANSHWQLHLHYYPPLLRSATVKKFVASYELLAEGQRDLSPEQAANQLKAQSEVHYKMQD
jgi:UDPglucose--hexose-1-phosphate uridylyltransferase